MTQAFYRGSRERLYGQMWKTPLPVLFSEPRTVQDIEGTTRQPSEAILSWI